MENPSESPNKYIYKITNWKAYNDSLKKREKVSCWLSRKLLSIWREIDVTNVSISEQIYPDVIIEFCLTTKHLYHLPLRQMTLLQRIKCWKFTFFKTASFYKTFYT